MTNNTLKSTVEAIIASSALVVVTLDGTFNSITGAPVLSPRTRPDQRNKFLKDFCERVNPTEAKEAEYTLKNQIEEAMKLGVKAFGEGDFSAAIKYANQATSLTEQLDQPRVYYTIKPNVDLRTVAAKRAAKKAENAEQKAAKQAEKEAKAASKMAIKVEGEQKPETTSETHKSAKSTKKAA